MKTNQQLLIVLILLIPVFLGVNSCQKTQTVNWPEKSIETQPWTRWWWHGSAVNPAELTANMEELKNAGFGGVEITPIYDVKGKEDLSISFQSSEWMDVFQHTLNEGKRIGLGIDLANASGWPFGGPWIQAEDACKNVEYKHYTLSGGQILQEKVEFIQQPSVRAVGHRVDISEVKFPISSNTNLQELALDQVKFEKALPLQALIAYSNDGQTIDLTANVSEDGALNWTAPEGEWNLYAIFQGWHGKMVERAGTGGEGNVIDHFSEKAAKKFLQVFDEQSEGMDLTGLRAFFNDSYEVDDARGESNWTPLFFQEFQEKRGYDLKQYLPALFGNDTEDKNMRVLCDFRETISDLLLDRFTIVWADWAKTHGAQIRNQAHGSPANILDLYEASDIPETEGVNPMRLKMATSAGHVSGKPLIACEAATWLDEHFLASLSDAKQNFDRYLANGVNHIVYHGTPYSPQNDEWPGWLFYAAVHFAPTNPFWDDLKSLNNYVANCQSFMQNSTPNNDILLYFPIYDTWSEKGRSMLPHFGKQVENLTKEISEMLLAKGYSFDYISDRQIKKLTVEQNVLKAPGADYKTILVPACSYIPLETMQKLTELAKSGANVVFEGRLPGDVPGLANLEERQTIFKGLISSIENNGLDIGNGEILVGDDVKDLLAQVNVYPEEIAELGLWYNRVQRKAGTCYFISNWGDQIIDQNITLNASEKNAVWFNPMNGAFGKAKIEKLGSSKLKVHTQLQAGETLILQLYDSKVDVGNYPLWDYSADKIDLINNWEVSFIKGGPVLPETYTTSDLTSWTQKSPDLEVFSGTANYKGTFQKPVDGAEAYQLDLEKVCESAVVYLNGEKLATLLGPTYKVNIDASLLKDNNNLEIQVTNLMANRMIDMDKRGINYKKFYNINFSAHLRENLGKDGLFTAEHWQPLESGLLGPVTLTPLKNLVIN